MAVVVWKFTVCAFHRNMEKGNYAVISQACACLAQTERRHTLTRTLYLASYFASEIADGISIKFDSVPLEVTTAGSWP